MSTQVSVENLPEPYVIAEIGCNHRGSMQTAKEMIVVAKTCGARIAKFQKRNPVECLTTEKYNSPYVNPHSYGDTYGEHREFLEFTVEQHAELKQYAEEHGIGYSTSVWDVTSAREIISLNPEFIKVPSACNNFTELLTVLRDEYSGDVHISVGMTTSDEIDTLVSTFADCPERLVLYACTSGYPVPPEDVCLLSITDLQCAYGPQSKEIGFSGHHNGIAIDVAAFVLGARVIERHFTLDRTWKGTDHAASLEPAGMAKLVRDLHNVRLAMSHKRVDVLPIEAVQRAKLKFESAEQTEMA